jgi:hypothetical protein
MAEEIVACPSCGKKFRIPEGAPPGSFKCTACGAEVAYGAEAAPEPPARAGGGLQRGAGAAKAGRRRAGRGARRGKARRSRAAAEAPDREDRRAERERRQQDKGANTGAIVASVMGGLAVILLLFLALRPKDKPPAPEITDSPEAGTAALTSEGGDGTPAGTEPAGTGGETVPTTEPAGGEDENGAEEESGIGGTHSRRMSSRDVFRLPAAEIFVVYPHLESTPESERERIDELTRFLVDRDSGRKGIAAQNDLEKIGKPAVPALLSTWKGRTWDNEDDQLATDIVQRVLRKIAKDDGPSSDFHARFVPHEPIEPSKFERAGRMWIAWWLTKGIDIEKYEYAEE